MIYISKGVLYRVSDINNIEVSRCGEKHILIGTRAKLWLAGRCAAYARNDIQQAELKKLESMGLAEIAEPDDTAHYQLLTNCVICKANPDISAVSILPLNKTEKLIWEWIKNAGFKLTISELVYLTEKRIAPGPKYFGKNNWHTLINAIYTQETIFDRILEAKMRESPVRKNVVAAVLGLLRKKRVIVV